MGMRRNAGLVLLLFVVGLSACGDDDGGSGSTAGAEAAAETSITTTTIAVTSTQGVFPSGATVMYPSNWTSYGTGFTGSLELAIPEVANVSMRDAAASEYMYGPLLPEQETLDGAFDMMEFGMGDATIGERTLGTVNGREILSASVVNNGKEGVMAVTVSGDSYGSVYSEALASSLPPEAVDSILEVLASMDP